MTGRIKLLSWTRFTLMSYYCQPRDYVGFRTDIMRMSGIGRLQGEVWNRFRLSYDKCHEEMCTFCLPSFTYPYTCLLLSKEPICRKDRTCTFSKREKGKPSKTSHCVTFCNYLRINFPPILPIIQFVLLKRPSELLQKILYKAISHLLISASDFSLIGFYARAWDKSRTSWCVNISEYLTWAGHNMQ